MKCPGCGNADAYVGLRDVKCASLLCRFFDNDYATEYAAELLDMIPEIDLQITTTEVKPASELQRYSSSAGYRQAAVIPQAVEGQQSFTIGTRWTPIMLDRVYLLANTLSYPPPFIDVTDVPGVSFTVTWLGSFDLTPTDDVIIAWFTD